MSDKRIIEEPASEEIFHDDWLVKDSPLNETTKIQASVFMALVADEAKDGMVPYAMLATEWTALTTYYKDQVVIYNGELYRAKDTNVSPTFNPSAWTKISFDTLYRTTLANVKNSICEEWSTSGEYTLNDCAIHEDKLYKCIADTATVGTWVSNEWELVSIYEIIQNLPKSASDVTYDNTESGLENENVQDALDEVAETITELSNTTEVTGTASGAIATFTDGADAPLKDLKVAVTPYQDLHGYDAPWAGGAGKNLFNYEDVESISNIENNNGTFTNTETDTRTYFAFTVQQYNGSAYVKSNNLNISASGRYSFPITIDSAITRLRFKHNGSSREFRFDFPFTKEGTFCVSVEVTSANPTVVGGVSFKDVMIESGSTMTDYEPYSNICPIIGWDEAVVTVADDVDNPTVSHEYTIDLDGTRYGGTLDATNGTMTVDRAYVDMGSQTWGYTNGRFYYNPTNAKVYTQINIANLLCSQYPSSQYSNQADNSISSYAGYIYVRADSYSGDTTAFKTAMNGVQLVYELATPITVQLSPTQVKSLEGVNNIFANCGDINNVEYVRNLNITINDLLSRING